jgi:quinol-cytochrome oxidoreductase complex cytochrome b subunit
MSLKQKISQPKNEPAIKSYHHEKSKSTKGISYFNLMMLIVLKIFFIAFKFYFFLRGNDN